MVGYFRETDVVHHHHGCPLPMGKAQSALKACCKPSVDAASELPPEHLTLDAAYAPSIPDSVDSQFRLASQARDGRQRMQVVQHAQE